MYNSNIPLECTQLDLIPHYVISYSLISGKVTSLAFSNVHPAALATHAFKDFPLVNWVLAVDSTLLYEYLYPFLLFSLHEFSQLPPFSSMDMVHNPISLITF